MANGISSDVLDDMDKAETAWLFAEPLERLASLMHLGGKAGKLLAAGKQRKLDRVLIQISAEATIWAGSVYGEDFGYFTAKSDACREAIRAHDKHGDNSLLGDAPTPLQRHAALCEGIGEAAAELTYDKGAGLRGELIQVASVAASWATWLREPVTADIIEEEKPDATFRRQWLNEPQRSRDYLLSAEQEAPPRYQVEWMLKYMSEKYGIPKHAVDTPLGFFGRYQGRCKCGWLSASEWKTTDGARQVTRNHVDDMATLKPQMPAEIEGFWIEQEGGMAEIFYTPAGTPIQDQGARISLGKVKCCNLFRQVTFSQSHLLADRAFELLNGRLMHADVDSYIAARDKWIRDYTAWRISL